MIKWETPLQFVERIEQEAAELDGQARQMLKVAWDIQSRAYENEAMRMFSKANEVRRRAKLERKMLRKLMASVKS